MSVCESVCVCVCVCVRERESVSVCERECECVYLFFCLCICKYLCVYIYEKLICKNITPFLSIFKNQVFSFIQLISIKLHLGYFD